MDETRHRLLVREIRRGIIVWKQGIESWAAVEPNARHALLAHAIVVALVGVIKALAAWSEDGRVVPGSAHALPRTGNRPPRELTDNP